MIMSVWNAHYHFFLLLFKTIFVKNILNQRFAFMFTMESKYPFNNKKTPIPHKINRKPKILVMIIAGFLNSRLLFFKLPNIEASKCFNFKIVPGNKTMRTPNNEKPINGRSDILITNIISPFQFQFNFNTILAFTRSEIFCCYHIIISLQNVL